MAESSTHTVSGPRRGASSSASQTSAASNINSNSNRLFKCDFPSCNEVFKTFQLLAKHKRYVHLMIALNEQMNYIATTGHVASIEHPAYRRPRQSHIVNHHNAKATANPKVFAAASSSAGGDGSGGGKVSRRLAASVVSPLGELHHLPGSGSTSGIFGPLRGCGLNISMSSGSKQPMQQSAAARLLAAARAAAASRGVGRASTTTTTPTPSSTSTAALLGALRDAEDDDDDASGDSQDAEPVEVPVEVVLQVDESKTWTPENSAPCHLTGSFGGAAQQQQHSSETDEEPADEDEELSADADPDAYADADADAAPLSLLCVSRRQQHQHNQQLQLQQRQRQMQVHYSALKKIRNSKNFENLHPSACSVQLQLQVNSVSASGSDADADDSHHHSPSGADSNRGEKDRPYVQKK